MQIETIALIDAAFGDGRAAIGAGDGSVRAGDFRGRQPLRISLTSPVKARLIPSRKRAGLIRSLICEADINALLWCHWWKDS